MATKHTLVRTIYLYLFTIIGLVLLVIGSVRIIDMGLKIFIFKQAEAPERFQQIYSCQSPLPIAKLAAPQLADGLTADETTILKNFLDNYQKCQADSTKIDYLTSNRQKNTSTSLAMILVGLPLYLYHWRIIKKETKKEEE